MLKTIFHFLATLLVYAAFDLAFINIFAGKFIRTQVGPMLAEKPDLIAALVFYFIFTGALIYFCIAPAGTPSKAAFNGAFFGLAAYATYELVNRALLAGWPYALVVVDIAWGIFVGAAVSWIGFYIRKI